MACKAREMFVSVFVLCAFASTLSSCMPPVALADDSIADEAGGAAAVYLFDNGYRNRRAASTEIDVVTEVETAPSSAFIGAPFDKAGYWLIDSWWVFLLVACGFAMTGVARMVGEKAGDEWKGGCDED